ncbi:hypothetical protein EIN_396640 [Entamoeba invadens IP1]|uniref:Uncharacterized protein n=1 Tax=Entamoeba invadens IP1 TaxID=370355 RepID=A0A0A1UFP7_ENTIV|nr:hypothetical protein EIN_396640 [Entamoeba invadens IP1]ELP91834.1 hypothetical protein EIN_396640 [Entamoeba invadens IP1]|eukprot:XP_004258605.1 hypothetical protein EIN_396640 [Entamoeba invadens IP1]
MTTFIHQPFTFLHDSDILHCSITSKDASPESLSDLEPILPEKRIQNFITVLEIQQSKYLGHRKHVSCETNENPTSHLVFYPKDKKAIYVSTYSSLSVISRRYTINNFFSQFSHKNYELSFGDTTPSTPRKTTSPQRTITKIIFTKKQDPQRFEGGSINSIVSVLAEWVPFTKTPKIVATTENLDTVNFFECTKGASRVAFVFADMDENIFGICVNKEDVGRAWQWKSFSSKSAFCFASTKDNHEFMMHHLLAKKEEDTKMCWYTNYGSLLSLMTVGTTVHINRNVPSTFEEFSKMFYISKSCVFNTVKNVSVICFY